MRKIFIITLFFVSVLAIGLPWAVNHLFKPSMEQHGIMVRLYKHESNKIETIPLEDYVTGVVAAEMPAEFPPQALMAQAVAARTYIYKRMAAGGVVNGCDPDADTCDDPSHAQAYLSREEMKKRWGTVKYYQYYYKVRMAVDDTAGEIVTFNGQPIDPVFHASCGGRTENSGDVWKFDVPYLRSVACPYDADPRPVRTAMVNLNQLEQATGADISAVTVATGKKDLIQVTERTATGRPKVLLIGSKKIQATDLRNILKLRSTNFTWQLKENGVLFETVGYGHGVGMCQYGAKGLAEHGYDYTKIIKHYYTGVSINNIYNK